MDSAASVAVVVVTYESAGVLESCLRGLMAHPRVHVVVVDNHSRDSSAAVGEASGARVTRLRTNAGFARACNRGVREFGDDHEWLAFVNPDVIIDGAALVACADAAPVDAGAVTPLLLDIAGEPVADIARPEPSLAGTLLRHLATSRAEWQSAAVRRRLACEPARHFATEVTSGGCLLVRRTVFDAVDGFSEAYFLNFEDVELCARIRQQGWRIVVDRAVVGTHLKGTSSSTVRPVQRLLECVRAEVTFFERNRPAWQTVLVGMALTTGAACRALVKSEPGLRRSTLRSIVLLAREVARAMGRSVGRQPAHIPAEPMFVDA